MTLKQGLLQNFARVVVALLVAAAGAGLAQAQTSSAALLARHGTLRAQLANNAFQRPLYLESSQNAGDQQGDVYAVVEQPFTVVSQSLQGMDNWCELLILHLNVKHCRASGAAAASVLSVSVGKKFDQPLADTYKVNFSYRVLDARPDFLQVKLAAENGPLGTNNYSLVFEAVPLDAQRSFIHMSYSYAYGTAARMAMKVYLNTIGSGKVGFTVTGRQADGQPIYVDGVRGVVERNTMRYYLAIESYLGAPGPNQVEQRLASWFDATERHAQQLHEMERAEYLEMKKKEVRRQREG